MKSLKSDGQRFLADLFFQSKPRIFKVKIKKKVVSDIVEPENLAYFEEQLVPSLNRKFGLLN